MSTMPPNNGQYPDNQQYPMQPVPKKKNWFLRHKILTALLAIVVIAIAASAGQSNSGNSNNASSSSSSSDSHNDSASKSKSNESDKGEKKEEKKDELPAVGTPVRDGKFEFLITKVERGVPSVGGEYLNEKAQGSFTLVHVTIRNIGDKPQTMMDDDTKAMDASGTQYSVDSTAGMSIEGNDVWLTEINPGNQVKGVLVFDTPADVKLTKIEFHDSMFSGGVEASL